MMGWWPRWDSLSNPGRRLRGELVMRGLRERGVEVEWFDPRQPARYRCVVLGARSDAGSCEMAQRLKAGGCRLLMDLCDNHLMPRPSTTTSCAGARCGCAS
ncbi:hypothetical protein [Hydrocarboniphaga sp.]|uniref:hypothetical protein n=1 Tax=Hydrocarboniphaga sp. TaxID=2033016 RepID=UPI003D0BCAE3